MIIVTPTYIHIAVSLDAFGVYVAILDNMLTGGGKQR